jgi:YD repeat-containing protein
VTGQITNVRYNADQVWLGNASNWDRAVDYAYAPDKLNRTSMNDNGNTSNYTYSPMNQYVVNGAAYNYDGNFNPATAPNWAGGFDAQNQLTSVAHGWDNAFFTYDGLGRCVRRIVYAPNGSSNTVLYTYDGWKPVEEWDGAGNFHAWNIHGAGADEILWRCSVTGGHVRYHHDRHGNVTPLLGPNGEGLERYTYDAFGKPTSITDWWGTATTTRTATTRAGTTTGLCSRAGSGWAS